jgi:hypothetical protein
MTSPDRRCYCGIAAERVDVEELGSLLDIDVALLT